MLVQAQGQEKFACNNNVLIHFNKGSKDLFTSCDSSSRSECVPSPRQDNLPWQGDCQEVDLKSCQQCLKSFEEQGDHPILSGGQKFVD